MMSTQITDEHRVPYLLLMLFGRKLKLTLMHIGIDQDYLPNRIMKHKNHKNVSRRNQIAINCAK